MVRHSVSTEGTADIWNTGQKCVEFLYPRSTLNKIGKLLQQRSVYGVRKDYCYLMRHIYKMGYVFDRVS
jgi:hypothetical protein